jgi:hypothetical protein
MDYPFDDDPNGEYEVFKVDLDISDIMVHTQIVLVILEQTMVMENPSLASFHVKNGTS